MIKGENSKGEDIINYLIIILILMAGGFIIFGIHVSSNIVINYKDILSDIGIFLAIILVALNDYIRDELKYYNK